MKCKDILKNYQLNKDFWKESFEDFEAFDVDNKIIDCFDGCKTLKKEDLRKAKNLFEDFEISEFEFNKECIDIIGLYCEKENIILMAKDKIKEISRRRNIPFECLYNFVKAHELAHGLMSLIKDKEKQKLDKDWKYIIAEESIATAFALKVMKKSRYYKKLLNFVEDQPSQYKYGKVIYEKFGDGIEGLMYLWRIAKRDGLNVVYEIFANYKKINKQVRDFLKMDIGEVFANKDSKITVYLNEENIKSIKNACHISVLKYFILKGYFIVENKFFIKYNDKEKIKKCLCIVFKDLPDILAENLIDELLDLDPVDRCSKYIEK